MSEEESQHHIAKHIPDTKVLTRISLPILMQSQLHWAGYVVQMKDHYLLKKLLYGKPSQGELSQEGQKMLQRHTENLCITPNCLEYLVQNRNKWCEVVKCGVKVFEISHISHCHTIPCPHCPKLFCTQIGLISHLRTHGCLPQS